MNFTEFGFNNQILKAIEECGYDTPTPVQEMAMPIVLDGKDLMASAQTGTGKTAAFVLPALQLLGATVRPKTPASPRILVLTPTRELADQIYVAARNYGRHMRVRTACILGGMPYREQFKQLAQCDIVVATPGRLLDHLERGNVSLRNVKMFVLDEADRMLDMGFIGDIKKIAAESPADRQTLLFTATLDNEIVKIAKWLLTEPERVDIIPDKVEEAAIEQRLHMADGSAHKDRLLQHFAGESDVTKAIIFSGTKVNADKIALRLQELGHAAAALHGGMDQRARNRTIARLRSGSVRLLVATDVAARGLDVTGISHVINFDLPKTPEDYIHRIGRTGRAGATGIAISFATHGESRQLQMIERYTGKSIPRSTVPGLEPMFPSRRPSNSGPSRNFSRPQDSRGGYAGSRPSDSRNASYSPKPATRDYSAPRPEASDRYSRPERPAEHGGYNSRPSDGRNSSYSPKPATRDYSAPRPEASDRYSRPERPATSGGYNSRQSDGRNSSYSPKPATRDYSAPRPEGGDRYSRPERPATTGGYNSRQSDGRNASYNSPKPANRDYSAPRPEGSDRYSRTEEMPKPATRTEDGRSYASKPESRSYNPSRPDARHTAAAPKYNRSGRPVREV